MRTFESDLELRKIYISGECNSMAEDLKSEKKEAIFKKLMETSVARSKGTELELRHESQREGEDRLSI